MPLRTATCNDIIAKYKFECGMMESLSNDDPSQSHASFLSKLLAISKQDVPLSEGVIRSYKELMNHTRRCSIGRVRYASDCLLPGEADIGHSVEIRKIQEIYLEMQKTFSRMKEKLHESEQSIRIDDLVEKRVNEEETETSNIYDWLDEGNASEDEPESSIHEWEHSGEVDTERQKRVSRRNTRRQHKENIRQLKEQARESRDSKLFEIRNHMTMLGTFFSENMKETLVGERGEEISLIAFKNVDGLVFTLEQMKNIILYSKLHADLFCSFIIRTHVIKLKESLSGVTTADCINTLKRISTRSYLIQVLRCPSSAFVMNFLLLTNPKDHVLDNLDHLARIDPFLFSMLCWQESTKTPFNEENNVDIVTQPLFQIVRQKPDKFQFIVGTVSKAIRSRIEKTNSILPNKDFSKVYNLSSKVALSIIESGGSRAGITIPIDTPNQAHLAVEINEGGMTYEAVLPCNLKEDGDTIQVPRRYRPTVEGSGDMYVTGVSSAGVRKGNKRPVATYLYQNDERVYGRATIGIWHEFFHFTDFRFEYV